MRGFGVLWLCCGVFVLVLLIQESHGVIQWLNLLSQREVIMVNLNTPEPLHAP